MLGRWGRIGCTIAAAAVVVAGIVAVGGTGHDRNVTISAGGTVAGSLPGDGIPGGGDNPGAPAPGSTGLGTVPRSDGDSAGQGETGGTTRRGGQPSPPAAGASQTGTGAAVDNHGPDDRPVEPASRPGPPVTTTTAGSWPGPGETSTTRSTPSTTAPGPTTSTTVRVPPVTEEARTVYVRGIQQGDSDDTDLFSSTLDGDDERQLTVGPGHDQSPAWSPDGSTIAFTRIDGDRDELWLMNPDGSNQRPVTSGGAQVKRSPAWSPDGRYLAFQSGVRPPAGWMLKIAILDLRTGAVTDVTSGPDDRSPSFSPDGTKLAFVGQANNADSDFDVYIIGRDGSGLRNVTNSPVDNAGQSYADPQWNTAGTRLLVYHQRSDGGAIVTMDLDGGNSVPITTDDAQPAGSTCGGTLNSPSWSPDEKAVLFNGCDGLRIVNIDGSGLRRLDPPAVTAWRTDADWRS